MKVKISRYQKTKRDKYLELLKAETEDIRELIEDILPAYNKLLALHALTFEEFALRPLAKQQGLPYMDPLFSYSSLKPSCVACGESKKISKIEENKYKCNSCGKKFAANYNSISSDTRLPSVVWMQVLLGMLNFYGMDKTCKICNITYSTYYLIRNRILYGMSIMMEEVKLYGKIEVDNTFIYLNYKGLDLNETDYPEDSPFNEPVFVPRKARKRGGRYNNNSRNFNSVCIFTGIDDYGHVFAKYVGIGAATTSRLKKAVPKDKILEIVPNEDPFKYKGTKCHSNRCDIKETIIVSDKEGAILKFAKDRGYKSESHVYRRNGIQCRLPKGTLNIQKVNNLHKNLQEFFRKINYVSTKYLPGYLTLFEFINNTGASNEAIGRLFEILATPNLGKPKDFYNNYFTIPNYIIEASKDGNLLSKFSYEQLYAAYLYDKFRNNEKLFGKEILVKDICAETGYSYKSVRRLYNNFYASGVIPKIRDFFENEDSNVENEIVKHNKAKNAISQDILYAYDKYSEYRKENICFKNSNTDFFAKMNKELNLNYTVYVWLYKFSKIRALGLREPLPDFLKTEESKVMLEIYDKYYNYRLLPYEERCYRTDFFEQINKEYKFNFTLQWWVQLMSDISNSGIKPPLPPLKKANRSSGLKGIDIDTASYLLSRFEKIKISYMRSNLKPPPDFEICELLSSETGYPKYLIQSSISYVKNKRKNDYLKACYENDQQL